MASGRGRLQAYEKTSVLNAVVDSYPSVVRFLGHVQLKGVWPRTVEAYRMMLRLLDRHLAHPRPAPAGGIPPLMNWLFSIPHRPAGPVL